MLNNFDISLFDNIISFKCPSKVVPFNPSLSIFLILTIISPKILLSFVKNLI
tara:strand:+ start:4619 stop:4774 length:156 start_codon:yes stop_codon:yes gene_type:complete